MKSKDLIDLIEMASHLEEGTVSALSGQIRTTLNWFEGTNEEVKTVADGLETIEKESKQDLNILNDLKKLIQKEGNNVY